MFQKHRHHGITGKASAAALLVLLIFSLAACSAVGVAMEPSGLTQSGILHGGTVTQTELILIGLLVVAAAVSIISQRLRIPYTVGLVLAGFVLTLLRQKATLLFSPDVILAILIPPLVFEAAFHLNFSDLRRNLPVVLSLAVPGVIVTTLVVGGLVSAAGGIGIKEALIFGAMISATDPVAVVALFRSLGVPRRLQVILEGESLFNDGTAIVVFNIVAAYAVSGHFNLGSGILEFLLVSGGGILVGAACGIIVSQLIGRIDNYLVETTLTTILAYGSYLAADMLLGVSGVLAVVAAGLAYGRLGPKGMSPTTRIVVFNFWEYAAFLANSFVFLIIGLQIAPQILMDNAAAIGWGILAVLTARAVTVYGLAWIGKGLTFQWKNVLYWSGLRGAISLALALSLAENIPGRQQIQAMAFGVVLFTLVIEGLTMKRLLRWSGITGTSESERSFNRAQARVVAVRAAFNRLKQMNANGLISDYTWRNIRPALEEQIGQLTESLHTILDGEPQLYRDELVGAWREALRTQRSTLTRMFRDNNINEETYIDLAAEVDSLLAVPAAGWLESQPPAPPPD